MMNLTYKLFYYHLKRFIFSSSRLSKPFASNAVWFHLQFKYIFIYMCKDIFVLNK